MKKLFLATVMLLFSTSIFAHLNIQLHSDFGNAFYGKELSNRAKLTATIENFTPDKWGSTFLFVDADFAGNKMGSVYAEISREFVFDGAPLALHIEYNGGLSGSGSYNDAYLFGAAYNWANKDFSKTLSFQAMYKYLANQPVGSHHSAQMTCVWGLHFGDGKFSFSGFADLWYDNAAAGNLVFCSEPQFWFHLNSLKNFDDDCKLSVGTEFELSNNLVWPTDGINNEFYFIPTLAVKWTF